MSSVFDFSAMEALSVPILFCNVDGKVVYRNSLARKRLPFCADTNLVSQLTPSECEKFAFCTQTGKAQMLAFSKKKTDEQIHGLLLRFSSELYLLVCFAELQPLVTEERVCVYLQLAPQLAEFFHALAEEQGMPTLRPLAVRISDAEAKSGVLTQLLYSYDMLVGKTQFHIVSVLEELLVAVKDELRRAGAQILVQNHLTPYTYRYSRFPLLPLSLVKLMLFALLISEGARIGAELCEAPDRYPLLKLTFRANTDLPAGLETDDFHVFSAFFPQYYPMLFGYLPTLSERGCRMHTAVADDRRSVSIQVKVCADLEANLMLSSPIEDKNIVKLLYRMLTFGTDFGGEDEET